MTTSLTASGGEVVPLSVGGGSVVVPLSLGGGEVVVPLSVGGGEVVVPLSLTASLGAVPESFDASRPLASVLPASVAPPGVEKSLPEHETTPSANSEATNDEERKSEVRIS
jgi:hypothetical protein